LKPAFNKKKNRKNKGENMEVADKNLESKLDGILAANASRQVADADKERLYFLRKNPSLAKPGEIYSLECVILRRYHPGIDLEKHFQGPQK
jgi:hypothetical protein